MLQTEVYIELSCGIRFHEGVKNMKKKCVLMMLIAIMTASLAGCGSSKDGSSKSVKLDPDRSIPDNLALLQRCPTGNV